MATTTMARGGEKEAKETRSDEELLGTIRAAAGIRAPTKATYEQSLLRVQRIVSSHRRGRPTPLAWILRHSKVSMEALGASVPNRSSSRTLVTSVLALLKHSGAKKRYPAMFGRWFAHHAALKAEVDREETEGVASGRQVSGAVMWEDVLRRREDLARSAYGSREHLLLSMYTYLPPRRQSDYHRVSILASRPYPPRHLELPAFLDLTVDPPPLVVTQFKTVDKYSTWRKVLSQEDPNARELLRVIRASLAAEPRAYLFVQKDGAPFQTVNAFTQFSNRTLKKVFVGPVTVNSLRHAATKASLTDPGKSYKQKGDYALDMGHSFDMHRRYDKVLPDELRRPLRMVHGRTDPSTGREVLYDCRCEARSEPRGRAGAGPGGEGPQQSRQL